MKWFGRTDNWNRKFSMKETLEKLLKGIQATWEKEEFDGGLSYSFKFQGGHFKALFSDDTSFLFIAFPFFATIGIKHLHELREICNKYNLTTRFTKMVYTPMEENADNLAVHLETSIRVSDYSDKLQNDFQWLLETCFQDIHALRQQLQDLENGKFQGEEEERITRQAETAMLQMLEETCLDSTTSDILHGNTLEEPTIGSLLAKMWQTSPLSLDFQELTIVTERMDHITVTEEIRDFKIASLLTHIDFTHIVSDAKGDEHPMRFVRSEATGIVHFALSDKHVQTVVIYLSAENEHSGVLSMRVTMACPQKATSPTYSLESRGERTQQHYSFLLNLYTQNSSQDRMECEYRLQEAKEAQALGKTLTKQQLLLLRSKTADIAYNVFCGHRHLICHEYIHAIAHFENVFYTLHCKDFDAFKSTEQKLFNDVCFYLGLSYMKIGMLERAQFFLDFILEVHSYGYAIVITRNMMLLHDPRIAGYVNGKYKELIDMLKTSEGNEMPSNIYQYKHFLMILNAKILVDKGEILEAMQWAKALADEGCDSEYLKKLMEYLKQYGDLNNDKRPELRKQYEKLIEKLGEDAADDILNTES